MYQIREVEIRCAPGEIEYSISKDSIIKSVKCVQGMLTFVIFEDLGYNQEIFIKIKVRAAGDKIDIKKEWYLDTVYNNGFLYHIFTEYPETILPAYLPCSSGISI